MILFGTSFSDLVFSLRYNELFETVYLTNARTPESVVPPVKHPPDDAKIVVLEIPEPFVSRIAKMDPSHDCDTETR
jgi:hypothetical protein